MRSSFPAATRAEYLSGEVTPLIRATLRRLRLDFGASLYLENEESVIVATGYGGDDYFDLASGQNMLWGDSCVQTSSPYAKVRVVAEAAWTSGGSSTMYRSASTSVSDDWSYTSLSGVGDTLGQYTRLGMYAESGGGYYCWYIDDGQDLYRRALSSSFSWGSKSSALNLTGFSGAAVHPVSETEAIVVAYTDPYLWTKYVKYTGSWSYSSDWAVHTSDELIWADAHWSDAVVNPADSNEIVIAVNLSKWGSAHALTYNTVSGLWSQPREILPSAEQWGNLKVRVSGMSVINSRIWAVTTRVPVGSNDVQMAHHVALAASDDGRHWRDEDFVTIKGLRGKLLYYDGETYCYAAGNAAVARGTATNVLGYDSTSLKHVVDEASGAMFTMSGPGSAPEVTLRGLNVDGDSSDLLGVAEAGNEVQVELGASGQSYGTYMRGIVVEAPRTQASGIDMLNVTGLGYAGRILGNTSYRPPAAKIYDSPYSLHSTFQFANGNARLTVRQEKGTWVSARENLLGRYVLHCRKPEGIALVPHSYSSQALIARVSFLPKVSVEGIWFTFWWEDSENYWIAGVHDVGGTNHICIGRWADGAYTAKIYTAMTANLSVDTWYSLFLELKAGQVRVYVRRSDSFDFSSTTDSTTYDATQESDAIPTSYHIGLVVEDFVGWEGAEETGSVHHSDWKYLQDDANTWTGSIRTKWVRCADQDRRIKDYNNSLHRLYIEPGWAKKPPRWSTYGIYPESTLNGPQAYFKDLFVHEGIVPVTVDDIVDSMLALARVERSLTYGASGVETITSSSVMRDVDVRYTTSSGSATFDLWASIPTSSYSGLKVTVATTWTTLSTVLAGTPTTVAVHPNMVTLPGSANCELRLQANEDFITLSADGHFVTAFPTAGTWAGGHVAVGSGSGTTTEFPEIIESFILDTNEPVSSAFQRLMQGRRAKVIERSDGSVSISRFDSELGDAGTYETPVIRHQSGENLESLVSLVEMVGAEDRAFYINPTVARRGLRYMQADNPTVWTQRDAIVEAKRVTDLSWQRFQGGQISLYIADPGLELEDGFTAEDSSTYVVDGITFSIEKDEKGTPAVMAEIRARNTLPAANTGVYGTAEYGDGTEYG